MQPIKQEPIEEHPPPHIKSEPTQYPNPPPDIKPEPVDHTPPPKRLKTQDSPSSSSKGKSIKEEEELITNNNDVDDDDESLVDSCGVCLLEQGMALQGFIDSCQHYFCFVCIMEWAKIESRCPICKRRFSTIRRPPKDGVFPSERIVNVPVRDQVHFFNGNSSVGPPDLYSQVKCSVCSHSSDDEVLLLCDLCDSAAHSYCVGLGYTVPEGDWFCKDCTLSRNEHAKVETSTTFEENNNEVDIDVDNENVVRFAQPDVSIRDIVRDSSIRVPRSMGASVNRSEQVAEQSNRFVGASVSRSEQVAEQSNAQPAVEGSNAPNARTLQRCLNVHARIRVLRENWNGFRGGSLSFSSQRHSNSNVAPHKDSYNTEKAWKMMDIAARAVGKKPGNKCLVNKTSKLPVKKDARLVNEVCKVRPSSNYIGGLKMHDGIGTSRSNDDKSRFRTFERYKHAQGNVKRKRELPSSVKIIACTQAKSNHYDNIPRYDWGWTTSDVVGSSDQASSTTTDESRKRKEINGTVKENRSIKKDHIYDSNIKEYENAKTEIQSLVKLNLKCVSRDKKLEVDVFKEVARHATHSIMAACGIEQPRARFRSFERVVCSHNEKQKQPSFNLMPTSCRECFLGFVNDVVTTIALDNYVKM
uniref:uncharacterized protein LOC122588230 n=1 Tax=Erigeron canadensis TaxID=72917 RepID=UPI001CB9AFA3|nr:uncharacterized protein LOC122588230 [Erigeron canadensis]